VADRAHAVFNGKVFVPKPAQLTDAGQLNRNLLLSPKLVWILKPQLEIIADVKCAHGTVSQLDDEEVFYLQSRGLDETDALLINALPLKLLVSCRWLPRALYSGQESARAWLAKRQNNFPFLSIFVPNSLLLSLEK